MVVLVMEICVDSVESAIAFVGALPSPDNQITPELTFFSFSRYDRDQTAPYEEEQTG